MPSRKRGGMGRAEVPRPCLRGRLSFYRRFSYSRQLFFAEVCLLSRYTNAAFCFRGASQCVLHASDEFAANTPRSAAGVMFCEARRRGAAAAAKGARRARYL